MNWRHKIKIKHLFTTNEDPESVDKSMREIAAVIESHHWFAAFDATDFYNCLEDDNPLEFANLLLEDLYDYADREKIWIE